MVRDSRQFWQALEQRWPVAEVARRREIARSVLVLLRRRIPPEDARQITAELPEDLRPLWSAAGAAGERTPGPGMEISHNKFLERVQQLAQLSDVGQAAHATAAVFGAIREVISQDGADQLADQLPPGLTELWCTESEPVEYDGGGSGDGRVIPFSPPLRIPFPGDVRRHGRALTGSSGASSFWGWLDERLEGNVAATAGAVAGTVLAHLRARLSLELADRVRAALPPDLRSYWAGAAPTFERVGPPERFVGRIAQGLDLTSELDAARHAAAVTLDALREMLPHTLALAVGEELPAELQSLWHGIEEKALDWAAEESPLPLPLNAVGSGSG